MPDKTYKLNPLSDYVKTLEDWELVEYISSYAVTKKWLLTEASHVTKKEMEKVWKTRYPEEPVPILGCVPPLRSDISIQRFLELIKKEGE